METAKSEAIANVPAEAGEAKPASGLLQVADNDLRVQSWCMAHIERIVPELLARSMEGPVPGELAAGVVRLNRVLFTEASARDAASARLWCDLSFDELAEKMVCDPSSVKKRYWPAAIAAELALDAPLPGYAQRKRRRNRWDVIAAAAYAAAEAGIIPGPPLFAEPLDGPPSPASPIVEPVLSGTSSETSGTTPPVFPESREPVPKPVAPRHRFDSKNDFLFQNFAGGVRGGSAPAGAEAPLPPAVAGDGTGSRTSSNETGGVTPPVSKQLTLDFEMRMDAGQRDTHNRLTWLQDRFVQLEDWLRTALKQKARAKGKRKSEPEPDDDERSWEQRGQECLLQIRLLPSFDADKLLALCSRECFGSDDLAWNVEKSLATGKPKTVAAVERILIRSQK